MEAFSATLSLQIGPSVEPLTSQVFIVQAFTDPEDGVGFCRRPVDTGKRLGAPLVGQKNNLSALTCHNPKPATTVFAAMSVPCADRVAADPQGKKPTVIATRGNLDRLIDVRVAHSGEDPKQSSG